MTRKSCLRCELYAGSGKQQRCTWHSLRLSRRCPGASGITLAPAISGALRPSGPRGTPAGRL